MNADMKRLCGAVEKIVHAEAAKFAEGSDWQISEGKAYYAPGDIEVSEFDLSGMANKSAEAIVRAVLTALREPSEEIQFILHEDRVLGGVAPTRFTAAIDHILAPEA